MILAKSPRVALILALIMSLVALLIAPGCKKTTPDSPMIVSDLDGAKQLGSLVEPLDYALDLVIDPEQDTFAGVVTIRLRLTEATRTLILHGEDMTIERALLKDQLGTTQIGPHGALAITFPKPVEPGEHRLQIAYRAPLKETPNGLYRVKEGERWYAFTQFEPLAARKAFPSFDEPRFKTPYAVTITAPKHLTVAANAAHKGVIEQDGLKKHAFHTTKPLPTYLVAFAVGPFDVVEAPQDASPVPLRVLATAGRGHLASYALEKTPPILKLLTDYFGQEYPFDKLDLVAVPNFSAGAMENVGLVTFRESLLLLDPLRAAPNQLYATLSVITHELAHMWFGNLVTPAWWDDLWLNESFATWSEVHVLERLDPKLEPDLRQLQRAGNVMSADSMTQTRAIRQPIESVGDIHNAFDGITYGKGATVLRMVEAWIGPDAFRDGVREVMSKRAYGTLSTPELLDAMSRAGGGKPVAQVLTSFIDQPGVPLLKIEPRCDPSTQTAQLTITQSRYLPAGSSAPQTGPWIVPICLKHASQGSIQTTCALLDKPTQTIDLPASAGCPEWLHPNADENGYYRWSLPTDALLALTQKHRQQLSTREQLAVLSHLYALVEAQQIHPADLYQVAISLLKSDHSQIVSRAADVLLDFKDIAALHNQQAAFGQLLQTHLKPHIERLGVEPSPEELPSNAVLRSKLLQALAEYGDDPWLIANAKSLIPQLMQDPDAFPASRHWAILAAASQADPLLWDELRAALDRAKTPAGRGIILRAMGQARDPKVLVRSFELYLSDTVRTTELWSLFGPSLRDEMLAAQVTLPWIMERFDALRAKLGEEDAADLPYFASGLCDAKLAAQANTFFSAPERQMPGSQRNLSQALERVDRCIRSRAYEQDAILQLLKTPQHTP